MKRNFFMTDTTMKEALRGDHFWLELALDVDIKIRSANSHFVLNNRN